MPGPRKAGYKYDAEKHQKMKVERRRKAKKVMDEAKAFFKGTASFQKQPPAGKTYYRGKLINMPKK